MSEFDGAVFAFERCEHCGAVLVRCDEPLETDTELENLFDEALTARDELAVYQRLEQRFALLAFDPAWPALVVMLPLEEPVRVLSTARSDEAHARLSDWLSADALRALLARTALELTEETA